MRPYLWAPSVAGLLLAGCATLTEPQYGLMYGGDPSDPTAGEASIWEPAAKLGVPLSEIAGSGGRPAGHEHQHEGSLEELSVVYSCPMHPQVTSDAPGTCPICGMSLEPAQIYVCPMHPEVTSHAPGECGKCGMSLVPQTEEPR